MTRRLCTLCGMPLGDRKATLTLRGWEHATVGGCQAASAEWGADQVRPPAPVAARRPVTRPDG